MRQITESESNPRQTASICPPNTPRKIVCIWDGPIVPTRLLSVPVPAQRTYAGIANAISEFTPVVMCCNEADYANCKAVFKDNERVTVMEMSINDAWFRDTGATFLIDGKGGKAATDWHFNAYGGLVDGLDFPWDKDAEIARKMADYVGVRTYRPDHVILEGGSHYRRRRGDCCRYRLVLAVRRPHGFRSICRRTRCWRSASGMPPQIRRL